MVLDAHGLVEDLLHIRDRIVKKGRAQRIPVHRDPRRTLDALRRSGKPAVRKSSQREEVICDHSIVKRRRWRWSGCLSRAMGWGGLAVKENDASALLWR